jgi:hypothetical protein
MIVLANCVLRRIFETEEREAERYELKWRVNKNIVLRFKRHKSKAIPNTIILTNVTAVTSAKQSDSDTEPACFVRLINLCIT